MYELPGSPPDRTHHQPRRQAAEPGEGEQRRRTERPEAHHDTAHHIHGAFLWEHTQWLHAPKQS